MHSFLGSDNFRVEHGGETAGTNVQNGGGQGSPKEGHGASLQRGEKKRQWTHGAWSVVSPASSSQSQNFWMERVIFPRSTASTHASYTALEYSSAEPYLRIMAGSLVIGRAHKVA